MAVQTLAEMQNLATESFLSGVVDEIINADPVIARIPYESFQGTQKTWVRESTRPVPQFFDIDEVLSDGVGTKTQVTLTPQQIGHQVKTAGFAETLDGQNNQRAINVRDGLLGLMDVIGDKLIYGNNTSNSKEFDGLHAIIPAAQTENAGGALALSDIDLGIDAVKKGSIDHIVVNRNIARRISQWVNYTNTNGTIVFGKNEFGMPTPFYAGLPIEKSDRLVQTETVTANEFSAKTGSNTSTLFGLQYGMPNTDKPGIFGIQGPSGLRQEAIGWDQDKDVWIDRMVWYLGHGLGSTLTVFDVVGITDAAVTA